MERIIRMLGLVIRSSISLRPIAAAVSLTIGCFGCELIGRSEEGGGGGGGATLMERLATAKLLPSPHKRCVLHATIVMV